jgi:hypothetical protein
LLQVVVPSGNDSNGVNCDRSNRTGQNSLESLRTLTGRANAVGSRFRCPQSERQA